MNSECCVALGISRAEGRHLSIAVPDFRPPCHAVSHSVTPRYPASSGSNSQIFPMCWRRWKPAMPSVVSKARLPRARLDMGKSWKELRCTLYRVKNPLRCQLLVGQIKYVLVVLAFKNSSKRSICTGQLLYRAVDAVRQAERLASQWQKRAEQAETTKEEIKET